MERRVLHARKLESLGVLGEGVAHDFNNLLMSIEGRASPMREGLGRADVLEHLDAIDTATEHTAALTTQMLAYAWC